MSRVSTYLNFMGTTEEAFRFYGSVSGTEPAGEIARMGDMPSGPEMPKMSEAEKRMVAHMELPILAGHVLMGTDMLESMGQQVRIGNNVTINLEPDTRAGDRSALWRAGRRQHRGDRDAGDALGLLGRLPGSLRYPLDVQLLRTQVVDEQHKRRRRSAQEVRPASIVAVPTLVE
jgi:uncharacterized glyoxalase superfamily protein PhnB